MSEILSLTNVPEALYRNQSGCRRSGEPLRGDTFIRRHSRIYIGNCLSEHEPFTGRSANIERVKHTSAKVTPNYAFRTQSSIATAKKNNRSGNTCTSASSSRIQIPHTDIPDPILQIQNDYANECRQNIFGSRKYRTGNVPTQLSAVHNQKDASLDMDGFDTEVNLNGETYKKLKKEYIQQCREKEMSLPYCKTKDKHENFVEHEHTNREHNSRHFDKSCTASKPDLDNNAAKEKPYLPQESIRPASQNDSGIKEKTKSQAEMKPKSCNTNEIDKTHQRRQRKHENTKMFRPRTSLDNFRRDHLESIQENHLEQEFELSDQSIVKEVDDMLTVMSSVTRRRYESQPPNTGSCDFEDNRVRSTTGVINSIEFHSRFEPKRLGQNKHELMYEPDNLISRQTLFHERNKGLGMESIREEMMLPRHFDATSFALDHNEDTSSRNQIFYPGGDERMTPMFYLSQTGVRRRC